MGGTRFGRALRLLQLAFERVQAVDREVGTGNRRQCLDKAADGAAAKHDHEDDLGGRRCVADVIGHQKHHAAEKAVEERIAQGLAAIEAAARTRAQILHGEGALHDVVVEEVRIAARIHLDLAKAPQQMVEARTKGQRRRSPDARICASLPRVVRPVGSDGVGSIVRGAALLRRHASRTGRGRRLQAFG
jgi:hypothetical protein